MEVADEIPEDPMEVLEMVAHMIEFDLSRTRIADYADITLDNIIGDLDSVRLRSGTTYPSPSAGSRKKKKRKGGDPGCNSSRKKLVAVTIFLSLFALALTGLAHAFPAIGQIVSSVKLGFSGQVTLGRTLHAALGRLAAKLSSFTVLSVDSFGTLGLDWARVQEVLKFLGSYLVVEKIGMVKALKDKMDSILDFICNIIWGRGEPAPPPPFSREDLEILVRLVRDTMKVEEQAALTSAIAPVAPTATGAPGSGTAAMDVAVGGGSRRSVVGFLRGTFSPEVFSHLMKSLRLTLPGGKKEGGTQSRGCDTSRKQAAVGAVFVVLMVYWIMYSKAGNKMEWIRNCWDDTRILSIGSSEYLVCETLRKYEHMFTLFVTTHGALTTESTKNIMLFLGGMFSVKVLSTFFRTSSNAIKALLDWICDVIFGGGTKELPPAVTLVKNLPIAIREKKTINKRITSTSKRGLTKRRKKS